MNYGMRGMRVIALSLRYLTVCISRAANPPSPHAREAALAFCGEPPFNTCVIGGAIFCVRSISMDISAFLMLLSNLVTSGRSASRVIGLVPKERDLRTHPNLSSRPSPRYSCCRSWSSRPRPGFQFNFLTRFAWAEKGSRNSISI